MAPLLYFFCSGIGCAPVMACDINRQWWWWQRRWPVQFFSVLPQLVIYDMIYLLTASGLPPGGSCTIHIYTQTIHRTTQNKQYVIQHKIWEQYKNFGRVRAMPRLGELYPGICLTTEEKARKSLSQGSRTIRIHKPNNKNRIHKPNNKNEMKLSLDDTNSIMIQGLSGKYPAILNISRTGRVALM
jgi:hypothetical protein